MRKIKSKQEKVEKVELIEKIDEKEKKYTKIILLISWIIPFFGLYFIHFFHIKLPKRTKKILCEILNKNTTMIFIYLVLLTLGKSVLTTYSNVEMFKKYIFLMAVIFIYSTFIQIIKTYKWLNGEDSEYKYILRLFKEDNNG